MSESEFMRAALGYVAAGWAVVPNAPREKKPILTGWQKAPLRDAGQVREWWTRNPTANVGIATGEPSGFFVVDIDVSDGKAGRESLAGLEREYGPLPATRRARTGSGGEHLLFSMPAGIDLRNTESTLGSSIDTRATGGQIVAAPSIHPSGGVYEWLNDAPIAAPPSWLVDLLTAKTRRDTGPRTNGDDCGPDDPEQGEWATIEPPRKPGPNGNGDRYVAAALESEAANVANAKQGTRNATLNRAAHSLGQLVGGGAIGEAEVIATLTRAALASGLEEKETANTIRSGLEKGKTKPRQIPERPARASANNGRKPEAHADGNEGRQLAGEANSDSRIDFGPNLRDLPLSDAGNAEAFELLHGDEFRFCHTRGCWLRWDAGRWAIDIDGAAERAMLDTVRQRLAAGLVIDDVDKKKRHFAYCLACENAKRIADGLKSASKNCESLRATIDDFDRDPFALCVGGMAIDLRTGDARPATPADMFSLRAGAKYDPAATAPRWDRFLRELFPDDPAMLEYLRWLAGYWLTGSKSVQAYWILQGEGANGKTRFIGALMRAWGDYAKTTGFNTFDADKHEQMGNDLADLRAARLVFASEVDEERPLAEARMKTLASGDPVTCRHLYGKYFTYCPEFKPVLAVNVLPVVRSMDHGTWRRIFVIRFCQTFDPKADPTLENTLAEEAAGILNWAITGARDFLRNGGATLPEPVSVREGAEHYRRDSDTLGRWLSDCVIDRPGAFTASRALYSSYVAWCLDAGHKPKSRTGWGRDLARKYPTAYRDTVRPRGYEGLGILSLEAVNAPDAPDSHPFSKSLPRETNIEKFTQKAVYLAHVADSTVPEALV